MDFITGNLIILKEVPAHFRFSGKPLKKKINQYLLLGKELQADIEFAYSCINIKLVTKYKDDQS